jgi:uncharacterized damage-inducible protein DinB
MAASYFSIAEARRLEYAQRMTPETAQEILQFLLPQLQQESDTTRKLLAAVPMDCEYKPSDLCMTGLALASHIAIAEAFFLRGALNGAFEWKAVEFKKPSEALAYYDENVPALIAAVADVPGEQLAQTVTFAIWTEPRVGFLNMGMKHTIHHRGQLSAYLGPMGARVPSIYGPSADDPRKAASGD